MKTIKQGWDDGMCAVCCVAMATGTTVQDVYEFLNDGREAGDPICSAEEAMYLLSRGWVRGGGYTIEAGAPNENSLLQRQLLDQPAMIDVQSNNGEWEHALFWDGRHLRDPDPRQPETSEWEQYKVLRIWPLTRVVEAHLCRRLTLPRRTTPQFVLDWREGKYTANYFHRDEANAGGEL